MSFTLVLRGYHAAEVDALVERVERVLDGADAGQRAALREELRRATFPVRLRGYDREQVAHYRQLTLARLAAD